MKAIVRGVAIVVVCGAAAGCADPHKEFGPAADRLRPVEPVVGAGAGVRGTIGGPAYGGASSCGGNSNRSFDYVFTAGNTATYSVTVQNLGGCELVVTAWNKANPNVEVNRSPPQIGTFQPTVRKNSGTTLTQAMQAGWYFRVDCHDAAPTGDDRSCCVFAWRVDQH